MPGTFAHITLVDTLCTGRTLDRIGTLSDPVIQALLEYTNFCELGAVSPDYPYLQIGDTNSEGWANGMHYFHCGGFVRKALARLMAYDYRDTAAQKSIAWLFGFVAHVVADESMHPVIQGIVGPYEGNKEKHRRCEAHQDAYIFREMHLGNVNAGECLSDSGLNSCSAGGRLDRDIAGLWEDCLTVVPIGVPVKQGIHGPSGSPEIDEWNRAFLTVIEGVAVKVGRVPLICRVFDKALGIGYPESDELDLCYVMNLPTPTGSPKDYVELFRWVKDNTLGAWRNLGEVLAKRDESLLQFVDGDLDMGTDQAGRSIYW